MQTVRESSKVFEFSSLVYARKHEVSARSVRELHSASVHRERMDQSCRGHIGNLGHEEYFWLALRDHPPPTPRPPYRGQDGGFYTVHSDFHLHINPPRFGPRTNVSFAMHSLLDFLNFARKTMFHCLTLYFVLNSSFLNFLSLLSFLGFLGFCRYSLQYLRIQLMKF